MTHDAGRWPAPNDPTQPPPNPAGSSGHPAGPTAYGPPLPARTQPSTVGWAIGAAALAAVLGLAVGLTAGLFGGVAQAKESLPVAASVSPIPSPPVPAAHPKATISYQQPTQAVVVPWAELERGDCAAVWPTDTRTTTVSLVPCSGNHRAEVIQSYSLGSAARYPGDGALRLKADNLCVTGLGTTLTAQIGRGVELWFTWPTSTAWNAGRRRVQCVLASTKITWRGYHDPRLVDF